jgi:hypothetical protein
MRQNYFEYVFKTIYKHCHESKLLEIQNQLEKKAQSGD